MKKIFIILFFSSCFEFLFSTNFPNALDDLPIEINFSSQVLVEGDRVGFSHTGPPATPYGLFWAAGGVDMQKSAASGYIAFGTPLYVDKELNLDPDVLLSLYSDLRLSGDVMLVSSGIFEAKNGAIILSGTLDLRDNTLTLRQYLLDAEIIGNGNTIDFSKGGKIVFDPIVLTDLCIDNCYLKGLKEDSISFTDTSRDMFLTNCVLQLDGDFCANFDINIFGDVLVAGTYSFCVNRQLSIQNGGRLIMDIGTTFSMGYYGDIDTWGDGVLHFNGCNIEIGDNYGQSGDINNGFILKTGGIIFENEVHINDDGNHKFFQVSVDSDITFLSGARVILDGTTTFSIGGPV